MRIFGLILGGAIALFGLSIMFTPLRTYFLIGWMAGCVLLCNGLSMLGDGFFRKNRSLSKCIAGGITSIVGIILLVTDVQQSITQVLIVYLVAGGIMLSGFIECIIGYLMIKKNKKGLFPLIIGGISFSVGLAGMIYQNATVIVVGVVVGYHIVRIGVTIFMFARDMNKPQVIDL